MTRRRNKTSHRNTNGQVGKTLHNLRHGPATPQPTYVYHAVPSDCLIPGSIGSVRFIFSAVERDFRRRQPVIKKTRPANERRLLDGHPPEPSSYCESSPPTCVLVGLEANKQTLIQPEGSISLATPHTPPFCWAGLIFCFGRQTGLSHDRFKNVSGFLAKKSSAEPTCMFVQPCSQPAS